MATTDARWARIAVAPGGEFMVVWTDQDDLDGSNYGVFGRRYDATGTALARSTNVLRVGSSRSGGSIPAGGHSAKPARR